MSINRAILASMLLLIILSSTTPAALVHAQSTSSYQPVSLFKKELVLSQQHIRWLSNEVLGFAYSIDGYINYVNITSGETGYFYTRKYLRGDNVKMIYVDEDQVFLVNMSGYAALVNTRSDDTLWVRSGYAYPPSILYYCRGYVVIVGNNRIDVVNPSDGSIVHSKAIDDGDDFKIHGDYLVFRSRSDSKFYLNIYRPLDNTLTKRMLNEYVESVDYDLGEDVAVYRYSNNTLETIDFSTGNRLARIDLTYSRVEIYVNTLIHKLVITTEADLMYLGYDLIYSETIRYITEFFRATYSPDERYLAVIEEHKLQVIDMVDQAVMYSYTSEMGSLINIEWLVDKGLGVFGLDYSRSGCLYFYGSSSVDTMCISPLGLDDVYVDNDTVYAMSHDTDTFKLYGYNFVDGRYVFKKILELNELVRNVYWLAKLRDKLLISYAAGWPANHKVMIYSIGDNRIEKTISIGDQNYFLGFDQSTLYLTSTTYSILYRVDMDSNRVESINLYSNLSIPSTKWITIVKDRGSANAFILAHGYDGREITGYLVDLKNMSEKWRIELDNYRFLGGMYWEPGGNVTIALNNTILSINPQSHSYEAIHLELDKPIHMLKTTGSYIALFSKYGIEQLEIIWLKSTGGEPSGGGFIGYTETLTTTETAIETSTYSVPVYSTVNRTVTTGGEAVGVDLTIPLIVLVLIIAVETILLLKKK